ncbi:hypothetical protein N7495_008804 [Penicillium taxi]|uniref:uncharacterized protein n=1 Tax=Penicillium taxi TaxID=168475 RepID=UPI0025455B00|nr:uncharacterized protein N7495_008804 [Penicillium taxi]KAJ5888763.1 hypothetical protein N7495_008804 [Penicillium taxi]
MTVELSDGNRDGNSLNVPEDGQSTYIRRLEERLIALEQRLLDIEGTKQEHNDDKVDHEDKEKNKLSHPSFPPMVPEVRSVNYLQAFHHTFTERSIPAIELMSLSASWNDESAKAEAFRRSLKEFRPVKAIETVNDANANSTESRDFGRDYETSQIRVLSLPLCELLWPIICGERIKPNEIAVFYSPWRANIHYHKDVKAKLVDMEREQMLLLEDGEKSKARKLLEELRAYVRLIDNAIMPFFSSFKTMTVTDSFKVSWEELWHLFIPGETIYYSEAKSNPSKMDYDRLKRSARPDQRLWRVYTRYQSDSDNVFWVKAYCIDYNGESYVCVKEWFSIELYHGRVSVNSLEVYPIRFANEEKKIMEDAIEIGRGFMKTRDSKLMAHTGWSFIPGQDEIFVSGDVVVNFEETFKAHPDWKPLSKLPSTGFIGRRGAGESVESEAVWYWTDGQALKEFHPMCISWEEHQIPRSTKIEYCRNQDLFLSALIKNDSIKYTPREEDLHLLPSRLFGYSLQDRRFVTLDLSNLRQIEESRDKFKDLIINRDHEGMLRALVESHFRRKRVNEATGISTTNQDIVQNKGRGLVILLHGVPGVGKTSTAETIASDFQKPLLPITCGDLGLDPATVEKSLKRIFRVAQLWDCILLLDEADVFLSERVLSDLSRNALVSVFLRVLDYYSGILFLTTNRVGTIDEAFKSRIHISLYYPYLELEQTEKIWEVNLNRLAAIEAEQSGEQTPLSIDRHDILAFARKHFKKSNTGKGRWNGRQIRNAFLIASALAHYEKTHGIQNDTNPHDLNARHFKTVVTAGTGFEKYLLATRGMTDQEAAYLNNTRADHIQSPESRANAQGSPQPSAAKPPTYPGWANQYPSHPSFTPSQAQPVYNAATRSPSANNFYPRQPHQPHYVVQVPTSQDQFGQPPMATGYPQPRMLTPVPQDQSYEQGWNTHHGIDDDSEI